MLNSPHAYSQNKAFTKHIVDALMQSYEEKLNLEVSIPRKLYDTTKKYTFVMIRVCHSRSHFLSCMYIHEKFMTESR